MCGCACLDGLAREDRTPAAPHAASAWCSSALGLLGPVVGSNLGRWEAAGGALLPALMKGKASHNAQSWGIRYHSIMFKQCLRHGGLPICNFFKVQTKNLSASFSLKRNLFPADTRSQDHKLIENLFRIPALHDP